VGTGQRYIIVAAVSTHKVVVVEDVFSPAQVGDKLLAAVLAVEQVRLLEVPHQVVALTTQVLLLVAFTLVVVAVDGVPLVEEAVLEARRLI
jgi:uncharacterized membrane protein